MKTIDKLEDCVPDPENANEGTIRGEQLLERSLSQYGAARAIVVDRNGRVIGGNKTLQLAIEAGLPARVVQTDGSRLVVVMRADLDLATDPKARVLAYLDNRAAELGLSWKPEQLEADLARGVELGGMFTEVERRALLQALQEEQAAEPLLQSVLDFDTPEQYRQWTAAVLAITAGYEGTTFPDRLEHWLAAQMEVLDQRLGEIPEWLAEKLRLREAVPEVPTEVPSAD